MVEPGAVIPQFVKPRFRGWLHQFTFLLCIPATLLLLEGARHASSYVAAALYGASMALLFGTSAAYHRGRWTPRVRSASVRGGLPRHACDPVAETFRCI